MEANITREQAMALLREYNEEPFHIQHALTVEGVLRWYARELGCGADEEFWALAGLLHDIDFERWPEEHCRKAPELLREGRLLAGAHPRRLLPRVRHLLRRGAHPRDGEGPLRGG